MMVCIVLIWFLFTVIQESSNLDAIFIVCRKIKKPPFFFFFFKHFPYIETINTVWVTLFKCNILKFHKDCVTIKANIHYFPLNVTS